MPAAQKLTPTATPNISELEAAREAYRQLATRKKEIARKHALQQQAADVGQMTEPLPARAIIDVSPAEIDAARRNPLRTARRLEDLRDDMMQLQPELEAAKVRFEVLAAQEAIKLRDELRPAHERAVIDIARALELLSAALEAEAAVHDEFQRRAPMGGMFSPLPNLSSDLKAFAWLPSWDSVGSVWGREARRHGYLRDEQA
ncbi:hypothetical protein [Bradyrhizobium sp. USDA 4506]